MNSREGLSEDYMKGWKEERKKIHINKPKVKQQKLVKSHPLPTQLTG